jgi:hypothetical protein
MYGPRWPGVAEGKCFLNKPVRRSPPEGRKEVDYVSPSRINHQTETGANKHALLLSYKYRLQVSENMSVRLNASLHEYQVTMSKR